MEYLMHRGVKLPLIGFGTWCVGDNPGEKENEIETMKYGITQYGMNLIDTAEMYGLGKSERVVGELLKQFNREEIYLVSKIFPHNANEANFETAFQNSLEALGVDYLDLYLLHWRENANLQVVVDKMEALKTRGLIKNWGVSNFDVADMEDLFACEGGENCFANEILYNVSSRGVEYDLLKWDEDHDVLNMIYSPLANNAVQRNAIKANSHIQELCEKKQLSAEALMLSFVVRNRNLVTIFKTGSVEHLQSNMNGCFSAWSEEELQILGKAYAAPVKKVPLEKI